MKLSAKTDVGAVRPHNEDSVNSGSFPDGSAWAVVCDGMGGAVGGKIASSMAVDLITSKLSGCYRSGMQMSSVKNMLLSAITTANVVVFDKSRAEFSLKGMGTTVVAAVVLSDGSFCVAHAGDSRAYLLSQTEIKQLTKDHSMVQELYDKGNLSEEQMKHHPNKNIITRALGVEEDIEIDFKTGDLSSPQRILLCSDGLSNFVEEETMLSLSNGLDAEEYVNQLIKTANENGGTDNITAAVIEF